MTTYSLFSDAAIETALDAVGGEMMGTQDTELLKQIFVAAGNRSGGSSVSVIGDETFSTTGTTTYNNAGIFQRIYLTGTGPYTRKLVLSASGASNGDTFAFLASIASGSDAKLQIFNDSISGTELFSYTASATNDGLARLDFIFDGTEWLAASPNEVFETAAEVEPTVLLFLEADSLAYADGDPVALWESSSPGTLDATEDAVPGLNPPIFKTAIVNSLPVVRFNSASSEVLSIPATNIDAYSVLLVAKVAATPSQTILGNSSGFQQGLTFGAVGINPATGAPGAFPASLYNYDGTAITVPTTADIGDPSLAFRIYEYNRTASGVVTCKVNGVTVIGFTDGGGGAVIEITDIGGVDSTNFVDADIALLKLWNGVVPAGIMENQTISFASKYGITI
jgi:hypothetical protein